MANKKNYYYVLVFTDNGPVYVTKVNNANKTAWWNREEKPLAMTKNNAEDLAFGLALNFTHCVVAYMPFEIESQPYRYDAFECKFEPKAGQAV